MFKVAETPLDQSKACPARMFVTMLTNEKETRRTNSKNHFRKENEEQIEKNKCYNTAVSFNFNSKLARNGNTHECARNSLFYERRHHTSDLVCPTVHVRTIHPQSAPWNYQTEGIEAPFPERKWGTIWKEKMLLHKECFFQFALGAHYEQNYTLVH